MVVSLSPINLLFTSADYSLEKRNIAIEAICVCFLHVSIKMFSAYSSTPKLYSLKGHWETILQGNTVALYMLSNCAAAKAAKLFCVS